MRGAAVCSLAFLLCAAATAQPSLSPQSSFSPQQIRKGSEIFAQNCAACHGPRMAEPQGAFDLRKFPRDAKNRFVLSVSKGKNAMPPWGDLFKSDEIDALWAYVVEGEKP